MLFFLGDLNESYLSPQVGNFDPGNTNILLLVLSELSVLRIKLPRRSNSEAAHILFGLYSVVKKNKNLSSGLTMGSIH